MFTIEFTRVPVPTDSSKQANYMIVKEDNKEITIRLADETQGSIGFKLTEFAQEFIDNLYSDVNQPISISYTSYTVGEECKK